MNRLALLFPIVSCCFCSSLWAQSAPSAGAFPTSAVTSSPYSYTFTPSGGAGAPYTYSVSSGSLPAGLSLSSTGFLSGTPIVPGAYSLAFTVADALGTQGSVSGSLAVTAGALAAYTTQTAWQAAAIGTLTTLTVPGNLGGYGINSAPVTVSGVVFSGFVSDIGGTYPNNGPSQATGWLVDPTSQGSIASALPTNLFVSAAAGDFGAYFGNNPQTVTITATTLGGVQLTYPSFFVGTGAPFLGFVSSNASDPIGTIAVAANATNNGGAITGYLYYSSAYPALSMNNSSLSSGTVGTPYNSTIFLGSGGSGYYSWTAAGLPAGLSITAAGVLGGTPTASGVFTPQVTLTDTRSGATLSQSYSMTVFQPTTTSLSPSLSSPSIFGEQITLTASVTPSSVTGSVTFYDGVSVLGTSVLSGGTAQLRTSLLPAGTNQLQAYYMGNSSTLSSKSSKVTQKIASNFQNGFLSAATYSLGASITNTVAIVAGDFNADGLSDLATVNSGSGNVTVILGNSNGTFGIANTYTVGTTPVALAVGDFNGDGFLDLAVANSGTNNVSILLGNGNGTFQNQVTYSSGLTGGNVPTSIAIADLNGDGAPDLVLSGNGRTITTLLGTQTGTFGTATPNTLGCGPAVGIAIADFNADGSADLAVACSSAVSVLLGSGTGSFGNATSYSLGSGVTAATAIAVGDFNDDGNPDIATANSTNDNLSVLLGSGNGTFGSATLVLLTGTTPYSLVVGDFNGDGNLDIATANDGGNNITVLVGSGSGLFALSGSFATGSGSPGPDGLAVADFNGDGISDIAAANNGTGSAGVLLGLIPTSTALTSSVNPSVYLQNTLLTAIVAPSSATGMVVFKDGATQIGSPVTVNGGVAQLNIALLSVGSHTLNAAYTGDNTHAVSSAPAVTQTVNQAPTITTLMSSSNPVILNRSVTLTATVAVTAGSNIPAGTVTFEDGGTPLAPPVTLNNGTATLQISSLSVGTHSLIASYGGDPNDAASTSATVPESVGQIVSTTTLSTSVNPGIVGQQVTLTATVSPSSATGTLTFKDAGSPLGSTALTGGVASLSLTLGAGRHSLTDSYSGDTNDSPSTSSAVSETVNYPTISIQAPTLPDGKVGQPYSQLSFTATGGSGNFTWSATGLPAGMSMSSAGALGGTPTVTFVGSFSVTVTDQVTSTTVTNSFSLNIAVLAITISGPSNIGNVVAGGSVSGLYTAQGGVPPFTWSLGGASVGFAIDFNGKVSGTVSSAGAFGFSVQITDKVSTSATYNVRGSGFGITIGSLPPASTLSTYSGSIIAVGGTPPYSFSVSGLPAGLSSSGGAISGQPLTPGSFPINGQASDSGGLHVSAPYTMTVTGPGPLTIQTSSLPDGSVDTPYSEVLSASGGVPPYTWSVSGGSLPTNISLSSSGTVSGLLSTPIASSFGVIVADSTGAQVAGAISLTIHPAPLQLTSGATLPNGIALVPYPGQILSASGGTAPYTFSVRGSLPDGLTLLQGQISGAPTTAGNYSFTLMVTDSSVTPITSIIGAQMTVKPNTADLVLSTSSASFVFTTGTSVLPTGNVVTVGSSAVSQILNYSTDVSPSVPWLSVTRGSSTPSSIAINLTNAALSLTAAGSPYSTTITVTCTMAPCSGSSQAINVSVTVMDLPPQFSIVTPLLSLTAVGSNPQPASGAITIENAGGGSLKILSVTAQDSWLSVGSFPATITPGAGTAIPVTANPAGLSPGFYRTTVTVSSSAGTASVPITLFVAGGAVITLSPGGTQFSMPQGGAPGNSTGSFLVGVSSGSASYTAGVLSGSSWLLVGSGSGTATASAPGTVTFAIDQTAAAALSAGAYYGTIRVTTSGVSNSPQDFQVVLSVTPPNQPVTPNPSPAGLIFISSGSGALPQQIIQVFASSKTPLSYQASATTLDGSGWLSISPSTGSTSSASAGQAAVSVNPAALAPGVYRGQVGFEFNGAAVPAVNITLIITAPISGGTSGGSVVSRPSSGGVDRPAATSFCTGTQLVPTQTGLVSNFTAPASWPTPLDVRLLDNCGNAVSNGQVVALFSNGDPPLPLSAANASIGVYEGTWTPRKASSQVTIMANVSATGFPAAQVQLAGQVTPNSAPQLSPNGTLDIFNPQVGAGLGPGNIVQIYGSNLANQPVAPQMLPLPTDIDGTIVVIGGIKAPLYYVSPNQINAQIPFELPAGRQYQVIVSANGALTTPQAIQLNSGTPAILTFTSGAVVAQHADGTLISPTSPAAPGEYIVIYLTGLGDTDGPVPSGMASPADPLAEVVNQPALTINGNPVRVTFAGLTPGLVGLYQINFQVPPGLTSANYTLAISQGSTAGNTALLSVQQPPQE